MVSVLRQHQGSQLPVAPSHPQSRGKLIALGQICVWRLVTVDLEFRLGTALIVELRPSTLASA